MVTFYFLGGTNFLRVPPPWPKAWPSRWKFASNEVTCMGYIAVIRKLPIGTPQVAFFLCNLNVYVNYTCSFTIIASSLTNGGPEQVSFRLEVQCLQLFSHKQWHQETTSRGISDRYAFCLFREHEIILNPSPLNSILKCNLVSSSTRHLYNRPLPCQLDTPLFFPDQIL